MKIADARDMEVKSEFSEVKTEVIVLDEDENEKLEEVSSFESNYHNFLNGLDKTVVVVPSKFPTTKVRFNSIRKCSECSYKTKHSPLLTYPYKCGECDFGSKHRFVVMNHYQMNHIGKSSLIENEMSLVESNKTCLLESCEMLQDEPCEAIEIPQELVESPELQMQKGEFSKKDCLLVPFDKFKVYKKELLECATCDYATYSADDLQYHSKIHLLYYPYKCNLCDFTAEKSFTVFNHYQLNHLGDINLSSNASANFKCHVCSFVTDNREVHNEHALNCYIRKYCSVIHKLTTNSDNFSCNMCSFKATHSFVLSNHVRMAHEFKNDSVNNGSNFISVGFLGAMYVVKDEFVITDS